MLRVSVSRYHVLSSVPTAQTHHILIGDTAGPDPRLFNECLATGALPGNCHAPLCSVLVYVFRLPPHQPWGGKATTVRFSQGASIQRAWYTVASVICCCIESAYSVIPWCRGLGLPASCQHTLAFSHSSVSLSLSGSTSGTRCHSLCS